MEPLFGWLGFLLKIIFMWKNYIRIILHILEQEDIWILMDKDIYLLMKCVNVTHIFLSEQNVNWLWYLCEILLQSLVPTLLLTFGDFK